jgi:hypothetical protein
MVLDIFPGDEHLKKNPDHTDLGDKSSDYPATLNDPKVGDLP